jgi:hypothetical protein
MSVFLDGIKVYSGSVVSAVPSGSPLITSTSSLSISLNEASISGTFIFIGFCFVYYDIPLFSII